MRTNNELVTHLTLTGVLKTPRIINAFEKMDRQWFVPEHLISEAYIDAPLPIGEGQTISQPWTVAFMLELLEPKEGDVILDIGSGSGWTTALLSKIVGEKGKVLGLERQESLVALGKVNLKRLNVDNAAIEKADQTLGRTGEEFDAILVSASASDMPEALYDQLNVGGRLVIPVKDAIYKVTRESERSFTQEKYEGFRFVPLIY